jgi:GNAT superfamily N-acetyltransferase
MADVVTLGGTRQEAAALVDDAAWAAARGYAAAPHTAVEETPRLRWLITGTPYERLNGIYWAAAGQSVDAALEPFRQADVPMLWHVGATSPVGLPALLRDAGLRAYEAEPAMVCDLGGPAARWSLPDSPDDLEIRRVGTEAQLRAWVRIWAGPASPLLCDRLVALRAPSAFGVSPRAPHLLAVLDGEPVGCAAVWVGRLPGREGRPVAWLEHVATRVPARRQGIGTALTRACLDLARRRAASHAALTASPSATHLYRRLGFRDVGTVTRYLWTPR